MIPAQAVKEIHRALQTIYSDSVVLLGGSYRTGEAKESSDLDFYILRGLRRFFVYRQSLLLIKKLKQQYPSMVINCMVIPYFFYKQGWYFVVGETVKGEILQSPLNTKIIFRTAIKLAYWNYLLCLITQETTKKQFTLTKMAQHLAVAKIVLKNFLPGHDGFSTTFLLEQLTSAGVAWKPVIWLLTTKKSGQTLSVAELSQASEQLIALADQLFAASRRYWGFLLSNYFIYNSKFLRHRNPLFLFKNPDKMVVDRLRGELQNKTDLIKLHDEMRIIIFPVIMI